MEANKDSDLQKCGEILINIKTIKNKSKLFTFHCALCSADCDQLKKFSKHLEMHYHYFSNILMKQKVDNEAAVPFAIFQPEEIKVEEIFKIELDVERNSKVASGIISDVNNDPLETKRCKKSEHEKFDENFIFKNIGSKIVKQDVSHENSKNNVSTPTLKEIVDTKNEYPNKAISSSIKNLSSDNFSEYSNGTDFDNQDGTKFYEKGEETHDSIAKCKAIFEGSKKSSSEEMYKTDLSKAADNNRPRKQRRVIIETILPILIQEYKQHKILWDVDNIAFGIKNKKFEVYEKIAEMLKLEVDKIISSEDINNHIHYLNDLYSKDREQELKCKIEKREFVPEYEYYTEMSFLSDSQGPFLCEICNQLVPKYDPYCQHMAQHNDTQPFTCPSCGMMFTNYQKYLIHKKRHLGILNFHCDVCGKGYLFKNDLDWHVTSHTGDKPYLCQICGTGFRARHGYDNHIRRHEERYRYECHICKRGFNQLHALNNHVKSHLNIRDVICKICGKGFVHTKYLKRHELIHGKEKRYKCNECGKAFFQACGLRAHRKNHHT